MITMIMKPEMIMPKEDIKIEKIYLMRIMMNIIKGIIKKAKQTYHIITTMKDIITMNTLIRIY